MEPSVVWFDTIDSTNEEAKRRIDQCVAGESGTQNMWLVSKKQTAGKGRMGRTWQSPVGNFFGTHCFVLDGGIPFDLIGFAAQLQTAGALAVIAALEEACNCKDRFRLKAPNDVVTGGEGCPAPMKVAGVLVELYKGYVIQGFGVNLAHAPQTLVRETGTGLMPCSVFAATGQLLVPKVFLSYLMRVSERFFDAQK